MMAKKITSSIAAISVILLSPYARSHHDLSILIELNSPITVTGKIVRVDWDNPHVVLHFESEGPADSKVTWFVHSDAPNILLDQGINPSSISNLRDVTIILYKSTRMPWCNSRCNAYGYSLTNARGTYILNGSIADMLSELEY